MPVGRASLLGQFARKTSAGLRVATSKAVATNNFNRAAIAATARMLAELVDDEQSTETPVNDRFEIGHSDLPSRLLRQVMGPVTAGPHRAYRSMK
jgi:hypothetical protein